MLVTSIQDGHLDPDDHGHDLPAIGRGHPGSHRRRPGPLMAMAMALAVVYRREEV